MKLVNRFFYLAYIVVVFLTCSCDDMSDNSPSNLRILPGQMLSANIDASGNMHFMPQMLMAEGGNPFHSYNWTLDMGSNPPSGVSLEPLSGIVNRQSTSGTGFSAGTTYFTVKVSDGDKERTEKIGLHITNYSVSPVADVQQLPLSEYQLMDAEVNKPYCASLFVMGGTPPYFWAIDTDYPSEVASLGLSLDPIYGLIKGTLSSGASGKDIRFRVVIRDSKIKTALFNPVYKIHIK